MFPPSFASHLGSRGTLGPGRSTYESLAPNMLQILVAPSESMLGQYIPNAAIRTCICVNVNVIFAVLLDPPRGRVELDVAFYGFRPY